MAALDRIGYTAAMARALKTPLLPTTLYALAGTALAFLPALQGPPALARAVPAPHRLSLLLSCLALAWLCAAVVHHGERPDARLSRFARERLALLVFAVVTNTLWLLLFSMRFRQIVAAFDAGDYSRRPQVTAMLAVLSASCLFSLLFFPLIRVVLAALDARDPAIASLRPASPSWRERPSAVQAVPGGIGVVVCAGVGCVPPALMAMEFVSLDAWRPGAVFQYGMAALWPVYFVAVFFSLRPEPRSCPRFPRDFCRAVAVGMALCVSFLPLMFISIGAGLRGDAEYDDPISAMFFMGLMALFLFPPMLALVAGSVSGLSPPSTARPVPLATPEGRPTWPNRRGSIY